MELFRRKNEATVIVFPMVTTAGPETFDTGETVTDTAYYSDAGGAWTSLAITDTVSEIGTTGLYELSLTAAEMNHDHIIIKLTSTNAADTAIVIHTRAIDDLGADTSSTDALAGAPPESPTLEQAILYIYKAMRNKKDSTSTLVQIYDDAGTTVDHKRTVSDNGTTFTEEEIVTGP